MAERDALIAAAASLLRAAILCRDIVSTAPPSVFLGFPEDISRRLMATHYQDSFDALPEDVRLEAQRIVDADPWIIEARRIHDEGGDS